ncbi:hypothetical protein [Phenylobacterium sp.]|uniref:hypothetical protein n=1 Tax=Phenylobacterium sp. TaxID=1871053 RepID=UPI0025DFFA4D|nr:hypothetical protein [Phenylobacterium sp.]
MDIPIMVGAAAWGSGNGAVEIDALPTPWTHLSLPFWDAEFSEVGFEPSMLAWGPVAYEDGGHGVLMDGIVVETEDDARRVARLLEERLGFFILEYWGSFR